MSLTTISSIWRRLFSKGLIFSFAFLLIGFLFPSNVSANCFFKVANSGEELTIGENDDVAMYSLQETLFRADNSGSLQSVQIRLIMGVDGDASQERQYEIWVGEVESYHFDGSMVDSGTILATSPASASNQQTSFLVQPGQVVLAHILEDNGEFSACTLQMDPPEAGDRCSFAQTCVGDVIIDGELIPNGGSGTQVCDGWITGTANTGMFCSGQTVWGETQQEDCTPCDFCNNGECNPGEGEGYCPQDCPEDFQPICGNGICEATEDSDNCLEDCPIQTTDNDNDRDGVAFNYCNQVPDGTQRQACVDCIAGSLDAKGNQTKIFTAVGCVNVSGESLAADLIRLLLGVSGGVALLSIMTAAFKFTISKGDSNQIKSAKELVTAAVSGLLFLIFSVIILEFVGVQILHIPGLG